MKTYDVRKRVSAQARREIQRVIETHEKFRRSYFWSPGGSAHNRRDNERRFERNNPPVAFQTMQGLLTVELSYDESCKHCYYSASIELDGRTKNISVVKKLLRK